MKKITDLKTRKYTTKETKTALGQRERIRVPIQMKRKIKTIQGGARFGHYLIDLIIITGILYLIQYACLFARTTPIVWITCCDGSGGYEFNYNSVFVILGYYALLESTMGRTLGKFATNSYVINEYAKKPEVPVILLRSLCRLVPFERFSCFGERGWHDKWTKTYVVNKTEWLALKKELAEDDGFTDDPHVLDA